MARTKGDKIYKNKKQKEVDVIAMNYGFPPGSFTVQPHRRLTGERTGQRYITIKGSFDRRRFRSVRALKFYFEPSVKANKKRKATKHQRKQANPKRHRSYPREDTTPVAQVCYCPKCCP